MKMRRTSAGCLGGTVWQHMSDSEDEEHGRIRFGHDGDYEDGQWIGGEFYARRQKQGRVMSKEEALYGYEGSSDEEGGRRGKKVSMISVHVWHDGCVCIMSESTPENDALDMMNGIA